MLIPSAEQIEANLLRVRERIERAAGGVGRDPGSIGLVAVTKGFGPEVIRLGYKTGLHSFGENRVEEAGPKQAALVDLPELVWHMVGHIQSRKAKLVAPAFDWVHSVDRLKIAASLNRILEGSDRRLPILLQFNVSGEPSKSGWMLPPGAEMEPALAEIAQILNMPNLEARGLMTMAPIVPTPEDARPIFRRLSQLRTVLREAFSMPFPELSMGMTDDFEVAIEEGATLLRIGRAIFGPRHE